MRTLAGDDERFHGVVSKLSAALATDAIEYGMELRMARALELLERAVRSELGDEADVLVQVIRYESTPYGLLEQHFGRVGMHYSSYCDEAALAGDELDAFRGRPGTVTTERRFPYDVKSLVAQILADGAPQPATRTTTVGFVVEQTGRFATYYVDGAG